MDMLKTSVKWEWIDRRLNTVVICNLAIQEPFYSLQNIFPNDITCYDCECNECTIHYPPSDTEPKEWKPKVKMKIKSDNIAIINIMLKYAYQVSFMHFIMQICSTSVSHWSSANANTNWNANACCIRMKYIWWQIPSLAGRHEIGPSSNDEKHHVLQVSGVGENWNEILHTKRCCFVSCSALSGRVKHYAAPFGVFWHVWNNNAFWVKILTDWVSTKRHNYNI